MGNFVRFIDSVNMIPGEVPKEVRDYYTQALQQGLTEIKPLRVRIAATHSGKITRNNGFYLPHKMRSGAQTFTDQYPKPIQVHHEDTTDPIGRVIHSAYIDLSGAVFDSVKDSVASESQLKDFVTGQLSFEDSIQFASEFFINDLKVSSDPNFEGLGYVEIIASISDPDAIQKILDGRYLTGSVGASTNAAVCSVCKEDWAKDGPCEHRPGKVYDGVKCVIIAGDLIYDEYSFVNRPADRHSRIIEVNINGIQDFVDLSTDNELLEITLIADHSKEERNMYFKQALDLAVQQERFQDQKTLVDDVKKIVDENKDLDEAKLFELLDATYETVAEDNTDVEDTADEVVEDATETPEVLTAEVVQQMIQDAVTTALASNATTEDTENENVNTEAEETVQDSAESLQTRIQELEEALEHSRKEVRYLHTDMENLMSTSAQQVQDLRSARIQHIVDMKRLAGENVDFDKVSDDLKEENTEDLVITLKDASEKVDTQKIIDTLNSGLSNEPTGEVSNPTVLEDNSETTNSFVLTESQKDRLKLDWLNIRMSHGQDVANTWLEDKCKALDINIEQIVPKKEQS